MTQTKYVNMDGSIRLTLLEAENLYGLLATTLRNLDTADSVWGSKSNVRSAESAERKLVRAILRARNG